MVDEVFAGVAVDSVAGTISWSNGIDLDPDVLHGDDASASVVQPQVVLEWVTADELKAPSIAPTHEVVCVADSHTGH